MAHAQQHYRHLDDAGQLVPTSQIKTVRSALRLLRSIHGATAAEDFRPRHLEEVQAAGVRQGLSRSTVNRYAIAAKAMFRWAARQDLIPGTVYHGLLAVRGLQAGRTEAPDHDPIEPAPPGDIDAALRHLRSPWCVMVQLQRLTGMRPGEVCRLRADQVDTSREPWEYVPKRHKTAHRGKKRAIYFGPQARKLLAPLLDAARPYLFPSRQTGRGLAVGTYRRVIAEACRAAGVPPWAPNRLRHSLLSRVEDARGIEDASAVAGHSNLQQTLTYAASKERARRAIEALG